MCKRWQMTPLEVLETPAGLLDRMSAAYDAWLPVAQFNELPAGAAVAWKEANPAGWRWLVRVKGWDRLIRGSDG